MFIMFFCKQSSCEKSDNYILRYADLLHVVSDNEFVYNKELTNYLIGHNDILTDVLRGLILTELYPCDVSKKTRSLWVLQILYKTSRNICWGKLLNQ